MDPGNENKWYDIYNMIWYDIWYDMIWYDMIWYDMIWYDMHSQLVVKGKIHSVSIVTVKLK
jgi:hypothetical protein